jgi:uncharacterized protein DUF6328
MQAMQLESALKTSLDELRMQMLGVQVLFGFQFQGLFQDNFQSVTASGKVVDAAALVFTTIVLGLIIAVPSQHRIVEAGTDTQRLFRVSLRYAKYALAPLGAAIACDFYVAALAPFGSSTSIVFATVAFLFAIGAWYVFGLLIRRKQHHHGTAAMPETKTSLHSKIEQMLTEARVILPGAQALLGFQLIIMMTKAFEQFPRGVQRVHLIALANIVLSIVLLIAPAAIHRVAFDGTDDPKLHLVGSRIITIALLPLACAIACDMGVALFKLYGNTAIAPLGATLAGMLLIGLWYLLPLGVRRGLRRPSVPLARIR